MRNFQTSLIRRDIDSAAKFIGAGAATVGVAGSGVYLFYNKIILNCHNFYMSIISFIFLVIYVLNFTLK